MTTPENKSETITMIGLQGFTQNINMPYEDFRGLMFGNDKEFIELPEGMFKKSEIVFFVPVAKPKDAPQSISKAQFVQNLANIDKENALIKEIIEPMADNETISLADLADKIQAKIAEGAIEEAKTAVTDTTPVSEEIAPQEIPETV